MTTQQALANIEKLSPALMESFLKDYGFALAARQARQHEPETQNYTFRNANVAIQDCDDSKVVLSGPAETGKTLACLYRLHRLALAHKNAQLAIVRKTYKSMPGSVLQTYERKILPYPPEDQRCQVQAFGGKQPTRYIYPNGSVIWLGGMDNPTRVLSSERDVIYVNQAEELTIDEWETLGTRATGRAGNMPYGQLMGDCNPGARTHWIKQLSDEGKLTRLDSRHVDNPTLYDDDGNLTEQGKRTIAVLEALTGVRRDRLYLGLWATAEGVIYDEYDLTVHLIDRFEIPDDWQRFRVVDFGFVNPFVCQWWAMDNDGRLYLYREIYHTQRLVEDHARQINALSKVPDGSTDERIQFTVADHDAEDRATLHKYGIYTIPAQKEVGVGIQAVQTRLKVQGDGKPRLFIMRDSLVEVDQSLVSARKPFSTEQEIESYVWAKTADGKPNKEDPHKEDDHGMDGMRYMVMAADTPPQPYDMNYIEGI